MKLTKSKLKEMIREELLKEQPNKDVVSISPGLRNDAQKAIHMLWIDWKAEAAGTAASGQRQMNSAKKQLATYFSKFIKGLR